MRVLFDTNVIVDVLQQREPWFADGRKLFLAVATRQIVGCFTAKQAADIHFFSKKQFKGEEHVDEMARQVVAKLYAIFELLDAMGSDCQSALAVPNNDYEDAMLITAALREHVDCIVTRNPDHFRVSQIPAYAPDELLKQLEQKSE